MFQEPDYTTLLGRLSLRARRVPAAIRIPLIVLALLAAGFCIIAGVGPYAFLAEAQASIFQGDHYPVLTGLLTATLFLTPAGLVCHLLAGLFRDNRPPHLVFEQPPPANAGPLPAYMQGGPYAQPVHGQAPYGQAPYGQAPYGQAPYGQAPYGQPPYAQPPQGQALHAQPPQGQAPHEQGPRGSPR